MNFGMTLFMVIGGGIGILTTLYLTLSIPVVIAWKLYRRVRYSIPLMK